MRKGSCSVEGCGKIVKRQGLCHAHWTNGLGTAPKRNRRPKWGRCQAEGCESMPTARGMCVQHYKRWRKTGSTDLVIETPLERFTRCTDRTGPAANGLDPCWKWTGSINAYGYPVFWVGRKQVRAHRWSYEAHVGAIPAGLEPDHLCHTADLKCPGGNACLHRRCVNPKHLEPVTSAENRRRAEQRRRLGGIKLPSRRR